MWQGPSGFEPATAVTRVQKMAGNVKNAPVSYLEYTVHTRTSA